MSRMNSRNRRKNFQMIVEREGGAFCRIGGEPLTFETAVIDHWNNNNDDNRPSNLCLLCKSMNAVKNSRGRDKRHELLSPMCGKIDKTVLENERIRTNSIELMKNMQAEPDFRHWLFWKIVHDGKVFFEDALDAGAAFARCSQETIRRYIRKELSEIRPYMKIADPDSKDKIVVFKPEWATFRQRKEDQKHMNRVVKNWKELMQEDAFSGLAQREGSTEKVKKGDDKLG